MRPIALFLLVVAAFFCFGCGGGSPSNTTPVSKIAKRAFISNQTANLVQIVDASKDMLSTFTISTGSGPTVMVESQDKKFTIVFYSGGNTLAQIDNATETIKNSLNLRDATDSFAISSDDHFVYVAERNTLPSGATFPGAVEIFDLTNVSAGSTLVSVPGARALSLSHNGSTLLVFSDNSNDVNVINTSNTSATPAEIHGFDRPVFSVFTSDDSTAYVLNCGAECGGTRAGVASVSVATQSLAATSPASFPARIALLNGGTLYVAGTVPGNPPSGKLTIVDANSLSAMPSVAITDGIHDRIALASNGKLFVGARACSNLMNQQGCLGRVMV